MSRRVGRTPHLENFLSRVQDQDLNKKSLESLNQVWRLDSFKVSRGELLANGDGLLTFVWPSGKKDDKQHSLFFAGSALAVLVKRSNRSAANDRRRLTPGKKRGCLVSMFLHIRLRISKRISSNTHPHQRTLGSQRFASNGRLSVSSIVLRKITPAAQR